MHLLDQDLPGVAQRLETLTPEARARLLAAACRFMAAELREQDFQVAALLDELSGGKGAGGQARAARLAEEADGKYFDLQEAGAEEREWMRWFSRARLLSGIATSFAAVTASDAADALYELAHVVDDPSSLLAFVEGKLAGG